METSKSTSMPPNSLLIQTPTRLKKSHKLILFSSLSLILLLTTAIVSTTFRTGSSASTNPVHHITHIQKISKTCSQTRHPNLCSDSLLNAPDSLNANETQLVHISLNVALKRVNLALSGVSAIGNTVKVMDTRVRYAYEDCLELLDHSVDHIAKSLTSLGSSNSNTRGDVLTWLSAALTNHDTCMAGFEGVTGSVKESMVNNSRDVSELLSNSLAIYAVSSKDKDFSGIPIQNRKRRLLESGLPVGNSGLPRWLRRRERKLLDAPVHMIKADIVVSQDGNGTFKTISQAIEAAPVYSTRRIIIYVKAGRYEEKHLRVGKEKTNLMFVGDGMGDTVISGGKSVVDGFTVWGSASFAAIGSGFFARDITFENWAGPEKYQAVALRVSADDAVVYRCAIIGYQDTLYVHSQRQFYRECDIYGTVYSILGNAAVLLQNCNIYSRKPMNMQKNIITAQNREDPNQNTGISIHGCRLLATPDLQASKGNFSTYLGRPWKLYSRTVYMQSYIGDHIDPRGWLEWDATYALDTLDYAEYLNYGPGAAVGKRVKWPGYHAITSPEEANKFTVGQFINGSSWLPSTDVSFLDGLSP